MTVKEFGNPHSNIVFIQPIDEQSLPMIDKEILMIDQMTDIDFCLKTLIVDNWFFDLSPWKNPPVFGNDSFGDGAQKTLEYILDVCSDEKRRYYIGGYSLAGLFSLWSAYQTDIFRGVAGASPSVWFPGFTKYMDDNIIKCDTVYLSLGDKEGKTRNPIMSTVDDCIERARETFSNSVKQCIMEYTSGNHFTDVPKRCARAISWVLETDLKPDPNI